MKEKYGFARELMTDPLAVCATDIRRFIVSVPVPPAMYLHEVPSLPRTWEKITERTGGTMEEESKTNGWRAQQGRVYSEEELEHFRALLRRGKYKLGEALVSRQDPEDGKYHFAEVTNILIDEEHDVTLYLLSGDLHHVVDAAYIDEHYRRVLRLG